MNGLEHNKVFKGDCTQLLRLVRPGSVDLAFVDPPFNIGYEYDQYNDALSSAEYMRWCREWGGILVTTLKPTGSLWVAIGDEYAAETKCLFHHDLGLRPRSWVVWHYTFGVNCENKFTRSHVHLLYFTVGKDFYFDRSACRVPSSRQIVYGDKRANPDGRLPDDTWILRPQDAPEAFNPESDTWHVPRVNGTFKERIGNHKCQMPERVLARIVGSCCPPGGLVLDPMAGTGTTIAVAKKLGLNGIGFELSSRYADAANERIAACNVGDPIPGLDYHATKKSRVRD